MSVSSRYSNGSVKQNGASWEPAGSGPLSMNGVGVKRQNALKRHSLPMGDNYVELIGKFEANLKTASRQGESNNGVYLPTKPTLVRNDSVPDMTDDGTPVVVELRTNVIIKDEFSLLTDLSKHLAAQYNKSSAAIMISLQHSTCITLGGLSDPCYLLNVTAVPSKSFPVDNKRVAQRIQAFLTEVLGVAVGRGIVLFNPMLSQNVAFQPFQEPKKETQVAQVAQVVKSAQLVDAQRRSTDGSWLSLPNDIANESPSDDDNPIRETLATLQGEKAGSIRILASERQMRRQTLHAPPNVPTVPSPAPSGGSSLQLDRRRTLQVPPRQSGGRLPMSGNNPTWAQLQERRRSLQLLSTQQFAPSAVDQDVRPSTSHGQSANDNRPRLDQMSKVSRSSATNGNPTRPRSVAAESWTYERQDSWQKRATIGNVSLHRPQSSGGERGRAVDWRVSQLLSPPTLHPPPRPSSSKSNSSFSLSSRKKPRPLSLPSLEFLSSLKSSKSAPQAQPQSPAHASPTIHDFDRVDIPPVPTMPNMSRRPQDRMAKRRSFVTALPQVESIPEVPPVPRMPEMAAVQGPNGAEEPPLRKRKSLFKIPFKKQSTKS